MGESRGIRCRGARELLNSGVKGAGGQSVRCRRAGGGRTKGAPRTEGGVGLGATRGRTPFGPPYLTHLKVAELQPRLCTDAVHGDHQEELQHRQTSQHIHLEAE